MDIEFDYAAYTGRRHSTELQIVRESNSYSTQLQFEWLANEPHVIGVLSPCVVSYDIVFTSSA